MHTWYEQAVFYHIYPLGLLGAEKTNTLTETTHRLTELESWIPHISDLNGSAIYIGPLFESCTHGYDTKDFRLVDRRLGSNEDFARFVRLCHENGIRVVVDGVFNHTGREFFAFQDIREKREASPYKDWYRGVNFGWGSPLGDPFGYEAWQGHFELPCLNLWNPEVRQYLDGKIRQAQWAIQAVEQRRATLLRCAQVLVRRQEAFFQSPGGSLTSLRLADVAAELSIHESTVSRAVREKYLQCARGVYPLSFFFPREVGAGEGQSAHEIKNQLLQLIREEDKSRPCSDQKLCQLLAEAGYAVSRRTVAKYREELGVSSAVGRRA